MSKAVIIPENPVSRFLFSSTQAGWFWLVVRLYVGYSWITAGWGKINNENWVGENAGTAIKGFMGGALAKAAEGKDVTSWYATFIENFVIPNAKLFSYVVAFGEVLVGLGLIVGLLTGIAAFCGGLMNVSFLLAGTVSSNPVLFILATWLVLAWKNAGWYGLDRWALPLLGTPWSSKKKNAEAESSEATIDA
ncbi:DoxX family protein [Paenibacillus endoradicis]|uniref:DoxX family protein n=1 Tax=Paenibacillus endoradicis TaxID=2972487 RepID=UPI002159AAE5|nr:DoxX family protein [Paenibacillus endoradicis]MCR8658866.1 DoxX family protein [Paenibacillus endoradicis]